MSSLALTDEILGAHLEEVIAGFKRPLQAKKFTNGQSNPTYLLTTSDKQYVLRRKPPGNLLKSAHAVDREFRVMHALYQSNVPVPQMLYLCSDENIIGSMFFVMQYVRGDIHWEPTLPGLSSPQRKNIYLEMCDVLAALHNVDVELVGLGDFGKRGNYFARQISRWTQQFVASQTEAIADMDYLIEWLPGNIPDDDGRVALVHGDYRLDNMIFHKDKQQVAALLDWELSTLGHPFADLAYQCMQLRMAPGKHLHGLDGIDRHALGIPTEDEYVARYCERVGIEHIQHWPFYLAFSFFRMASILQGVKKRAIDGNASSAIALEYGALVKPLAAKGRETIA